MYYMKMDIQNVSFISNVVFKSNIKQAKHPLVPEFPQKSVIQL